MGAQRLFDGFEELPGRADGAADGSAPRHRPAAAPPSSSRGASEPGRWNLFADILRVHPRSAPFQRDDGQWQATGDNGKPVYGGTLKALSDALDES